MLVDNEKMREFYSVVFHILIRKISKKIEQHYDFTSFIDLHFFLPLICPVHFEVKVNVQV